MAIQAQRTPTQHPAEPGNPPAVRRRLATGSTDPAPHHLVFLRPSVAIKIDLGPWKFEKGDELEGTLIHHPVNTSRKIIIRTTRGTFNVNQEDVADVSAAGSA